MTLQYVQICSSGVVETRCLMPEGFWVPCNLSEAAYVVGIHVLQLSILTRTCDTYTSSNTALHTAHGT